MSGEKSGWRAERIRRQILEYYDTLRTDGRMGCREAARVLGFPCYATLRNRLCRSSKFTIEELETIANAMNVSLNSLIGEEEEM